MASQQPPPALEPMRVYLDRSRELQAAKPIVAHYLRVFAMNIALQLRSRLRPADLVYVSSLMDSLEQERTQLEAQRAAKHPQETIREFAIDLSNRARSADKPEVSIPNPSQRWTIVDAPKVAQAYHASAVVLDSLRQFAPLAPDLAQRQQSAHKRSQQ
ncbi:Vps20-associated 1-like protein B [Emiliania huxleyi CCMP1516]|uniref:Vta1/callose synthase N-terminal domain-containing protein n=3 Tax=Emiliania huxleyi TaxID=2903 RepID=A0A0D3JN09_EMIH1|nr:hypothetical protein EMIHUDRAFT_238182 [Emiliania huxleyi CCMP1516]XP_005791069.1 Vps20-associated 1-like protein B [Emiliania huxleyi CCMP1516]EOD24894.1 hypothetical protein EMIHUDRAFT_238182 [Emiliania huxleyi CCMP1516]EOD38640.1 Vps20-associated 1-like protein B [Emiliania huxleyi CCMP1516]|eukprot:XP_005777323.1 hypothetical protein EMIHUDRAFT_238182 [Emiliania huxleyi CCMP1516]